jgi:glycosyltransferase involved in cell wall biosynthesis
METTPPRFCRLTRRGIHRLQLYNMKLSLYTAARNCLRQDYPILDMLRHHLPLADEIVVNDGFSSDGTYEAIRDLNPKIKVFREKWERPSGEHWWIHFKDAARRACTGDWCIHLDCDEFIPEWEFQAIREHLASTTETLVPVQFVNFYGNYRVFHPNPGKAKWITRKMIIHRNLEEIEFWGDGSNVNLRGSDFTWDTSDQLFTVHHFGAVRHPGRLREGWWCAGRFRTGRSIRIRPPSFVFDLFPHDWCDSDYLDDLEVYDGPVIHAVTKNEPRFIRDGMQLYHLISSRKTGVAKGMTAT